LVLLALLVTTWSPAAAQAGRTEEIAMTLGKSVILDHPDEIARISISNPEVADAVAVSTKEVLLNAKGPGITTLATVGYGDITPTSNPQMVYAIAVMILGAGVYGYTIANVSSILANIDPAKVRYREILEKLSAFMKYRNIPPHLQERILDYNAYLWEKRLGYDESAAIAGLPPSLRAEVSLFLNREIIERVPLFRGASEEFIRAVALQMRPVIFTPGDYIMRAGEPGAEMYFISRGTVEIVTADGNVVATLTAGDFFGEMALLLNQPRTAGARAMDYCDLYLLEKETFSHILARFPDFAAHIEKVAGKRQETTRNAT
jgi:voltage-gated potassium channel